MSKIDEALQQVADPCPICSEPYNGAYCHVCQYEHHGESASEKLDLVFKTLDLEDAPTADALAEDIRRAVHNIESQPLDRFERFESPLSLASLGVMDMEPGLPWIPTGEEAEQTMEDFRRRMADVFSVPHHLILCPPVVSMINITFTITPFQENFETELAELDRKAALEPQSDFDVDLEDLEWAASPFEVELEQLDYEADPSIEPDVGTFEWKLWALERGLPDIAVGESEPHEILHGQWHGDDTFES